MKRLFGLLLTMLLAQGAAANESAMKELMPTEKLRVALVFAPSMSIFFVVKEADGRPRGVTADLADALGRKLDVPVERVLFPNSGLATDALEAGQVDVAFMPVDEERRKRIAFGPNYVLGESTYMATAASGAKTVEEVDRAGMRVIGIANTTTIRAAGRTLKNTTITAVPSVQEAVALLRDGKADAFALSRELAADLREADSRLAHGRRRVPADRHRDRGREGQAGALAAVTDVHGRGEEDRRGPPRARQCRIRGSGRAVGTASRSSSRSVPAV